MAIVHSVIQPVIGSVFSSPMESMFFDPDAGDYFKRIMAAGSSISGNNKAVVSEFIIGCKADGIWDAIKASCILAGADTLAGALVPLKGTAPTNFNFLAGDYSRTTGLAGDGSTKYLAANYAFLSALRDNKHAALWVSTPQTTGITTAAIYLGSSLTSSPSIPRTQIFIPEASPTKITTRCSDVASTNSTGDLNAVGLIGISRIAGESYTQRGNSENNTTSVASLTGDENSSFVFRRNSVTADPFMTTARFAFYSFGENLNLTQLDARLTTLMAAIT